MGDSLESFQAGIKKGNVFVLQHSIFNHVVQFGCSEQNPADIAKKLSKKTRMPGEFSVVASHSCCEPCSAKARVIQALKNTHYVEDFYEVSLETAKKIVQREALRIPINS